MFSHFQRRISFIGAANSPLQTPENPASPNPSSIIDLTFQTAYRIAREFVRLVFAFSKKFHTQLIEIYFSIVFMGLQKRPTAVFEPVFVS